METLKKKSLFWDVELGTLSIERDEKFILGRILHFGNEDDIQWAMDAYGLKKIEQAISQAKSLDKKSLSFWCQYFNINSQLCTNRSLEKTQSAFSTR